MLCRFRPLFVAALVLTSLGLSACKTIYSDTYSWKKNNFTPPPEKQTAEIPPAEATQAKPVLTSEIAEPQGGLTPDAPLPPADTATPPASDSMAIPGL